MGTHSRIALEDSFGQISSIYCHWDGHVESNGATLLEFYTDLNKIRHLIQLGSISSLFEEVTPTGPHSFDKPQDGVTIAYHRDRGEPFEDTSPKFHKNESEMVADSDEPYIYLFRNNEWFYKTSSMKSFKKLTIKAIAKAKGSCI